MSNFLTIWRRELAACFNAPVAYVTMVLFLAVTGGTFLAQTMRSIGLHDPLPLILCASIVLWLTVLITVVSMRLFAEEKRTGTLESLMTAPVTEGEVVLGKFAGAFTFMALVTAPTVGNLYLLRLISGGEVAVDGGALFGGCLILALVAALCTSIGLLISLLTRNPIVAAVGAFCAIWVVLLFGWLVAPLPLLPADLVEYLSVMQQIEDFARGSLDSRPIVLYLSGTAFTLFASVRVLEARRWVA